VGEETISVCNQSPKSTQPSIPRVPACLAGVKVVCVFTCVGWVAGNTVWFRVAIDTCSHEMEFH